MKRFVEGEDRNQSTLFPQRLDEYIAEDNPVRVIDAFVDELDLAGLGFERVVTGATGDLRLNPFESQASQVQFINKGIDDPDRVVFCDVFIEPLGE